MQYFLSFDMDNINNNNREVPMDNREVPMDNNNNDAEDLPLPLHNDEARRVRTREETLRAFIALLEDMMNAKP